MPKISVCIPTHDMKNKDFFLERALDSIRAQTFQDYEIVVTEKGRMAENTNAAIKEATGEIIKILYMDDWLVSPTYLAELADRFSYPHIEWLITKSSTNQNPHWTDDIETGNNKLGSPSALAFRNRGKDNLLFDERMSWLLDCDLYKRLYDKYGEPSINKWVEVGIGIHDGQMTNILTNEEKLLEHKIINEKYK